MSSQNKISRVSLQLLDRANTAPKQPGVSDVSNNSGKSGGTVGELLDSAELAARLRLPESWVRSRTRARTPKVERIPHLQLGRYIRFSWPEVSAWLAARVSQ